MDELTSVYIQECREQLADMEAGLLRLEQAPDDRDNLNGIFRAAHFDSARSQLYWPQLHTYGRRLAVGEGRRRQRHGDGELRQGATHAPMVPAAGEAGQGRR